MLIGELAHAAGATTPTIRFYERQQLLPTPLRSGNGYRDYNTADLDRVRFIRAAQSSGLSLAEIRGILDIRDDGQPPCRHVSDLIDNKLAEVRRRMAELVALEQELQRLGERARLLNPAECGDSDICRIIDTARDPIPAP